MRRWLLAPLLVLAMPAKAGERRATFRVNAAVVTGCTVTTDAAGRWGAIDLGTVSGAGRSNVSGTLMTGGIAGIALSCTPGTNVSLAADAGDHALNGQRRLARAGGTTAIPYGLYANGATTPWTTQTVSFAFPVGTSARTLPVAAQATVQGPLAAGSYTDTVRITLSF